MDLMTKGADADPAPAVRSVAPGVGPLSWSPAWALEPDRPDAGRSRPGGRGTTVVLSAGADRRVAIDGVDDDQRAAVARWAAGGTIAADEVAAAGDRRATVARRQSLARLLDRLVALGVVVPVAPPGRPDVLADDTTLAGELADLLTESGAAGIVVAVRTGTAWPSVPPRRLLLGVDLSLHHTVVLGPVVVPGASACLACLDARVARRWPTPVVPAEPAVRRRLVVVAALLDVQLALVAAGTSPLVNATVAWNLETGATDRQSLFKLAGCPHCDTGPGDGRVALPWGAAP